MTQTEIEVKFEDHEHEIKSLKHRMDKAEDIIESIRGLSTSVQLLAQESKTTRQSVDSLAEKVEALDNAPKEMWSKLKTTIITAVATAIVTALISAIIANL